VLDALRDTYIVVLDGEQDETLSILLEQRLNGLFVLDGRCNVCLAVGRGDLLVVKLWDANNGPVDVLLIRRGEVKLLCGSVSHAECVDCRSSLCTR
jgi:hypothetical protein